MAICYKKLWKLLIDRDMKKKDLQRVAGISAASITKLGKNENVNTENMHSFTVRCERHNGNGRRQVELMCYSKSEKEGMDRWNLA